MPEPIDGSERAPNQKDNHNDRDEDDSAASVRGSESLSEERELRLSIGAEVHKVRTVAGEPETTEECPNNDHHAK